MGKQPAGPDEALIQLQKQQAVLLRDKERDAKLEKSARDRAIRNARNARSRTLLTSATGGERSIGPRNAS